MVASEIRQKSFSDTGNCSTDAPYTVKNVGSRRCAVECLRQASCEDFNHDETTSECALFIHKPLFYESKPGCAEFKAS